MPSRTAKGLGNLATNNLVAKRYSIIIIITLLYAILCGNSVTNIDLNSWIITSSQQDPALSVKMGDSRGFVLGLNNSYVLDPSFYDKTTKHHIHKSEVLLEKGGVVPSIRNSKTVFLCHLKLNYTCQSKYVAENVDLLYALAPIYSIINRGQPFLYEYHVNYGHYLNSIGIKMPTLEGIFPSRNQKFQVTSPGKEPFEIQLELEDTFYIRENLLNVMAKKLPGWEYLVWIDAHQIFGNTYWWEETLYKLDHYGTVQFFQYVDRLAMNNRSLEATSDPGVRYGYSLIKMQNFSLYYPNLWSGNAWGIRRELYNEIKYILDECISGCCDCAWCLAAMKDVNEWPVLDRWPNYKSELWPWIVNANRVFGGKTAFVRGNISHLSHEHGFLYGKMLDALTEDHFKIERDLYRDGNFTLHLKSPFLKTLYSENGQI